MSHNSKKICVILGTRPEIIKMTPIIRECRKRHLNFFVLNTNQHYSENLSANFFKELDLKSPKYNLSIKPQSQSKETAEMLVGLEKILEKEKPDIVLAEGDTNTVLASALACAKLQIKFAHIEAGLRSYFRQMPEEINRIVADHCADLLFCPTSASRKTLRSENIPGARIFVTGNTIVDAVKENLFVAQKKSKILELLKIEKGKYLLATFHRQENVDDKKRLQNILKGLCLVSKKLDMPVICPLHPRTRKMMDKFKIAEHPGIKCISPVGFFDFIFLEANAKLILTDSGGVQEESCILRVPCVTLRDNTERPETISTGSNVLAGADSFNILNKALMMANKKRNWKNPFGTGNSAEKIIDIVLKKI